MAELADALDLGSSPARGGGSTPPFRTSQRDENRNGRLQAVVLASQVVMAEELKYER